MTFITSERYKEELKRNLSFCHKFRSVPRSFQKELVPVTVPQKGTSSRNVQYLNEFLQRTAQFACTHFEDEQSLVWNVWKKVRRFPTKR